MVEQTLTVTAEAPGSMQTARDLAALAMSDNFSIKAAADLVTGGPLEVAATVAAYEASLRPLNEIERSLTGDASNALSEALSALGAKIAPTMTPEQAKAWRGVMLVALSDLPSRVGIRAAREAIHVPMKFMNEVETVVREKAAPIEARHREAIHRLRRLQAALEQPALNRLAAPEGYERGDVPDLTDDEIIKIGGGELGRSMLKIGVSKGYLSQERYDRLVGQAQGEGVDA
jgi:hypothetical protein